MNAEASQKSPLLALVIRGALGGVLMGLANLVPGISGGTMLLAAGIYPLFIGAVADVTTLKLKKESIVLLGAVVVAGALSILLGAGAIKHSVVHYRWIAYSVFIGLTLGGAPLIWRMSKPHGSAFWVGTVCGVALMALMAVGMGGQSGGEGNYFMTFVAGLAGSASMILPGVSGGYLLLVLGQYETILGAIDQVKSGLGGDISLIFDALHVIIPLAIGVGVGVVGISNLLKWLLAKYKNATLGVLFGLLLGAVIGLWPFQEGRAPVVGDVIKGRTVTVEMIPEIEADDWPVVRFSPTPVQAGAVVGLILLGFGITIAVDKLGERLGGEDGTETEA